MGLLICSVGSKKKEPRMDTNKMGLIRPFSSQQELRVQGLGFRLFRF